MSAALQQELSPLKPSGAIGVPPRGGLGKQEINLTCWRGGISKEQFSSCSPLQKGGFALSPARAVG